MAADVVPFDPHFDAVRGILRNLPGVADAELLNQLEGAATADALIRLYFRPVSGSFDRSHLQQIHRELFREIYPWAGELRQVNIQKPGSFPFARAQFLEGNLDELFARLASEKQLRGLDAASFAKRAAFYLGELNALHPFREGNGRTQREFVRQLAQAAGFRLSWARIGQEEMIAASIQSHQQGRNGALEELIRRAMEVSRSS